MVPRDTGDAVPSTGDRHPRRLKCRVVGRSEAAVFRKSGNRGIGKVAGNQPAQLRYFL